MAALLEESERRTNARLRGIELVLDRIATQLGSSSSSSSLGKGHGKVSLNLRGAMIGDAGGGLTTPPISRSHPTSPVAGPVGGAGESSHPPLMSRSSSPTGTDPTEPSGPMGDEGSLSLSPACALGGDEGRGDEVAMRMRRLGTLSVHLKEAHNLIKMDWNGLSDPYVVVRLNGQMPRRTRTIRNTLDPIWDEKIEFDCELGAVLGQPMTLELYDEDFGIKQLVARSTSRDKGGMRSKAALSAGSIKDDKLGRIAAVHLTDLIYKNSVEFREMALEGVKSGDVTFSVSWNEHATDTLNEIGALCERDPEMRAILKDVRRQMDIHAEKGERLLEKQATRMPGGGVLRARPTTSLGGGGEGGGGGGGGGGKGGEGNESNHSGASVGGSAVTTPASTPFPLRKSDDETGTQLGMPQPVPPPGSFKRAGKPMGPEPASEPAAAPPLVTTSVVLSPDAISATSETEEKLSEDGERKLLCCDARNWCRYLCGPVMHPDGRFRSGWNIMLAVFILYCGVSVPLEIAFDEDMSLAMCGRGTMREDCPSYLTWFWSNVIVDIWFMMDIVINFRTGFIREGHFVDDDWLAARAYLRSSFTIDTLGTFPINLILMAATPDNPYGNIVVTDDDEAGGSSNTARLNRIIRLVRMAKLLKLFRMAKLARYMSNFEDFFNPAVLRMTQIIFGMILCCHWLGCLWWLVSELEQTGVAPPDPTGEDLWQVPKWVKAENDFGLKYSHAILWGAGVVTAMIPYDVMPATALECTVTFFAMFVGLLLNAVVISSLTTALTSMNSKRELAGKQLDTIRNYLMVKAVPNDLKNRILEYYEYLLTSSQALASSINYDALPATLAAQLAISINRKLAARCLLFRDISNESFVKVIEKLEPMIVVPAQLIVFEGHPLTAVYFINRGLVQLLARMQPIALLRDNENFGFDDFIGTLDSGKPAVVQLTAKAVGYCDLMTLSVETLAAILDTDETFQRKLQRKEGIFRVAQGGGGAVIAGGRKTRLRQQGGVSRGVRRPAGMATRKARETAQQQQQQQAAMALTSSPPQGAGGSGGDRGGGGAGIGAVESQAGALDA